MLAPRKNTGGVANVVEVLTGTGQEGLENALGAGRQGDEELPHPQDIQTDPATTWRKAHQPWYLDTIGCKPSKVLFLPSTH